MEECLRVMQAFGAELVDPVDLKSAAKIGPTEMKVLYFEFKADLNAYLAGVVPPEGVHSIEDVIAFNERNRDRVMPYFEQEHFYAAQRKGPLTEKVYQNALETNHRLSREEGIDKALAAHKLDALVAPSGGPAALIDYISRGHTPGGDVTSLPAVAGYPHITVPAGQVYGMPVGISFFSSAYSEPVLFRLAYAFEQATQARREPTFPKTLQILRSLSGMKLPPDQTLDRRPKYSRSWHSVPEFKQAVIDNLYYKCGQGSQTASPEDFYQALAFTVRDYLTERYHISTNRLVSALPKFVLLPVRRIPAGQANHQEPALYPSRRGGKASYGRTRLRSG